MRNPGSILLISCYELGHQPAGLSWPLAFLERVGYQPSAVDTSIDRLESEPAKRALFVGISAPMHTAVRLGTTVARRIRDINPTCHICFYGSYAALNSDYLLATVADSTLGGEFEEPMVALVQALERNEPLEIPGVSVRGRPSPPLLNRLCFPVPSRAALPPLRKYAHLQLGTTRLPAGYVETTRGCLHRCRHCPIPPVFDGRLFVVPAEVVLADVAQQVGAGARHISFGDPDFLNGPAHSLRIVREMHGRFANLTFDFTAKVEHLLRHKNLLPELGRLGCSFVVSAVESLSDRVLSVLAKGHSRSDIPAALRAVENAGISFRPTWLAFTPWTTLRDYLDMLEFVEAEQLIGQVDPVQYAVRLLVPPGSSLLSQPELSPHLGALDDAALSYRWSHPDSRMDRLHRAVHATVERAVRRGENSEATFFRICELAGRVAGGIAQRRVPLGRPQRANHAPRLTESWFC